ncbi:hypothetical protein HYS31_03000 [Candidatus Woesearchaeota archaeon]|nr:hypothetical protein [Candidatus Woesearchaeota archaeon]
MKRLLLFFVALLVVPAAFSDVSTKTGQQVYNIGNKISASASVLYDSNFDGLLKLTLSCDSYKLPYFVTPMSLEAGLRTAVDVPDITATALMLGNCIIVSDLTTNDNIVVDSKESDTFTVTNQLTVLPVKAKINTMPGETVLIAGVVNEAFGNNVLNADAKIMLDEVPYNAEVSSGKFNLNLPLPKNIKTGLHKVEITVSDSRINIGYGSIEMLVTAVPSYLKMELSETQVEPGSKVEVTVYLYDQADDLINTSLELELYSPKKENVFKKIAQSGEKILYEFSQYAEPGQYSMESYYYDLAAKSFVNVSTVREIKIKYGNESVVVENIGNIPYDDELTFIVQNEFNKYAVLKKVFLNPGKYLTIDLSKEVPLGIYNVVASFKDGVQIRKSEDEAAQNLLANNVTIHDNRPAYKKFVSALQSFSAGVAGSNGLLARNPLLAPLALASVVLIIMFRYGRKPIMKLIKGRKKERGESEKKD